MRKYLSCGISGKYTLPFVLLFAITDYLFSKANIGLAHTAKSFEYWCQEYRDRVFMSEANRITIGAALESFTKDISYFDFSGEESPLDPDGKIKCSSINLLLQKMRDLSAALHAKVSTGLTEEEAKLWLEWNYGSRLNISKKALTSFEPLLLLDIDYLDISSNSLQILDIPEDSRLRFVKYLNASYNKLINLEQLKGLKNLVSLVHLDLSHNGLSDEGIRADQEGLFGLINQASQLTFSSVILANNKIRNLNGIENFRIEYADLANNLIGSYYDGQTHDTQISRIGSDILVLNLSYNLLRKIPSTFRFRSRLFYLNLDHNPHLIDVVNLPHRSLQYLSLNHTTVQSLNQLLSRTNNLNILFLADTKIDQNSFNQLSQEQFNNLTAISLSNTQVSDLNFLKNFSKLQFVDLRKVNMISDFSPLCEISISSSLHLGNNHLSECPCALSCALENTDASPIQLWLLKK